MALPVNVNSWPNYGQAGPQQQQPAPSKFQQPPPPAPPFSPPPPYQATPPNVFAPPPTQFQQQQQQQPPLTPFQQPVPVNFHAPVHSNSFPIPQHTNSFPIPQHTNTFPPAPPQLISTNSFPPPPSANSFPPPLPTNSFSAPPIANAFPPPPHTQSFPQAPHTNSFPVPIRNDSFPQPARNDSFSQRPPENMFDGVMNVRCDLCAMVLDGITHYHCQTCGDGDFDFCSSCYWAGRRCPCGAADIILLQFVPGHGRQVVDPSNYQGDNVTSIECESCHVKESAGTHWVCLGCKMAEYHICEGCYANEKRCPCGGFSTLLRLEFVPGVGRKPVAGEAQDYYGVPADPQHTQGNAAIQVEDLIPAQAKVCLPHENPRVSALHSDIQLIVGRPTPSHQLMYVGDMATYFRWKSETYEPKVTSLRSMIEELDTLRKRLHAQAEESASLGAESWAFLTPHLEIGDVLDMLTLIERRAEDLYQEIQTMEELQVDLESTANSTQFYQAGNTVTGQQWEQWKEPTKKTLKRAFHKERSTRKKAHSELLEKTAVLAETASDPQYEAVMDAIVRLKAIRTKTDCDILDRALTVLRCAKDSSIYIRELSFNARSEALQQEQVHGPMAEAQWQDQDALLQHQRNIIAKIDQEKIDASKKMQEHFVEFAEKPTLALLSAYLAANGIPTGGVAAAGMGGATKPGEFAMPYSYYQNMMTSMHATQMQVVNNIAGGNTNFHVANATTGQVLW